MSGMFMLCKTEVERILQTVIEEKLCAIMSFMSMNKWHAVKMRLTDLTADKLSIVECDLINGQHPLNIQINQPVGISFKHAYGKFVFDTVVVAVQPSIEQTGEECEKTIILAVPDHVEVVQRRSYFRVNVPQFLNINVTLWRQKFGGDIGLVGDRSLDEQQGAKDSDNVDDEQRNYYKGGLVDISAGGAQVKVIHEKEIRPDLKKGQYVGLRFTPMPYDMPLVFNALIRNITPAEDNNSIYIGLQIVGLEASPEGRQTLSRIAEVTKHYYQLNMSDAKHLDMEIASRLYEHPLEVQHTFSKQ